MSRVPVALGVGVFGFVAYIAAAATAADYVLRAPWPAQAAYFVAAGALWVLPARWLMYWAAGLR